MTRVHHDPSAGKPAKFITYSCNQDVFLSVVADHGYNAENDLEEAASVASSRESRVWTVPNYFVFTFMTDGKLQ